MNWRAKVSPDDLILHLGDLAFFSRNYAKRMWQTAIIKDLPGRKYIIKGNHDRRKNLEACGFEVIKPFTISHYKNQISFTHKPLQELGYKEWNIHGHVHNNEEPDNRLRHLNVSVEVMDYRPQDFEMICRRVLTKVIQ